MKYTDANGTAFSYRAMKKTTISDGRIEGSVDVFNLEDSSFSGFISQGNSIHSSSTELCVINMIRPTPDSEQDTADGTIVRISVGRPLKGAAWNNGKEYSPFNLTLQRATLGLGAASGLMLTAIISTLF